jgi:ABC-type phosphate/phosphonate transport system substrate-binding protein
VAPSSPKQSQLPSSSSPLPSSLPVYYSQLFVHHQSPYRIFSDLYGAKFAYNDDSSLSGYYCLLFYLQSAAATVSSSSTAPPLLPFFSSQISTGSHYNSILAVLSGQADVLCLDCVVYQRLLSNPSFRFELLKLRPIPLPPLLLENGRSLSTTEGLLGPNPAQPIVVTKQISTTLRNRIQEAFRSLPSELLIKTISPCPCPSPSSCCSCCSRYESVTKSDYDFIVEMMRECQNIRMGRRMVTASEEVEAGERRNDKS